MSWTAGTSVAQWFMARGQRGWQYRFDTLYRYHSNTIRGKYSDTTQLG